MKKILLLAIIVLAAQQMQAQITAAANGLSTTTTSTDVTVKLGGTLENAATTIDFGSGNSSSNLLIKKGSTNYFHIANGGNIGIGTASPTHKLHVESTGTVKFRETGGGVPVMVLDAVNFVGNDWVTFKTSNETYTYGSVRVAPYAVNFAGDYNFQFSPGSTGAGNANAAVVVGYNEYTADVPYRFGVMPGSTTQVGINITGRPDQTANLQTWSTYTSGGGGTSQLAYTVKSVVDPNGNFGIGNTAPSEKLHVTGKFRLADGTEDAGKVLTSNASGVASWVTPSVGGSFTTGSVPFAGSGGTLTEDNSKFFWDNTNKRLGIGTTTPVAALDVTGTGNIHGNALVGIESGYTNYIAVNESYVGFPAMDFVMGYGNTGNDGAIRLSSYAGNTYFATSSNVGPRNFIIQNYAGKKPIIFNQQSELARFSETNGNFLIGSSADVAASYKLQVTGTAYFDGAAIFNESGADKDIRIEGQADANLFFTDASTNRVGIGTSAPDAKLHVNGTFKLVDSYQSNGYVLVSDANGLARWTDPSTITSGGGYWTASGSDISNTNSGNINIGNTTPSATATPLSLSLGGTYSSTAGANPKLKMFNSGNPAELYGLGISALQQEYIVPSTASHVFYTGGAEKMRIASNGNVGIGENSPAAQLHLATATTIAGGAASTGLRVDNSSAGGYSNIILYNNQGRLGQFVLTASSGAIAGTPVRESMVNAISTGANGLGLYAIDNVGGNIDFTAGGAASAQMRLVPSGHLLIGTTTDPGGDYKLAVKGNVIAEKVRVKLHASGWPDYVFHPDYPLPTLTEVEQFIKTNKHLPGVASAAQVEKEGLDLGDGQAVLLKKIEEMTLYMLEMNKQMQKMAAEIETLKKNR